MYIILRFSFFFFIFDLIRSDYKLSLIPGTIVDLSTRVGLVVKNKSKVLLILVGSRTICSSPKSFEISSRIFDNPGAVPPGFGRVCPSLYRED